MVEGPNFYFGHGRAGTIDVLRRLCAKADIGLEVVEPVVIEGQARLEFAGSQVASGGIRR